MLPRILLIAIALSTCLGHAQHKEFVGANNGSNFYFEARVELGNEHNTYVVKVDRTDMQKSLIEAKVDGSQLPTLIEVPGTLERYFVWNTKLVLLFSTPTTRVLVLNELDPVKGTVGKVLDRDFAYGCDLLRMNLMCIHVHRDEKGQLVESAHIFDFAMKEHRPAAQDLPATIAKLLRH